VAGSRRSCSRRTDSFPRLGRRQMVLRWLAKGTNGKQLGTAWAGWPLGLEQGWHSRGRDRWRVLNNLRGPFNLLSVNHGHGRAALSLRIHTSRSSLSLRLWSWMYSREGKDERVEEHGPRMQISLRLSSSPPVSFLCRCRKILLSPDRDANPW